MFRVAGLVAQSGSFQLGPVEFDAPVGEITVILGENGSGKSTLLRAVLGEIPWQGQVALDGVDFAGISLKDRAKLVSAVPQTEEPPFHFTVFETVLMGCLPLETGRWESAAELQVAESALRELGIWPLRDRPVREISGGERQRTLIARSIAQNPRLLLLDEPTAHVDLPTRSNLARLIPDLAAGRSVLLTTHDIAFGTAVGSRCILLKGGNAVYSGPMDGLSLAVLESCFEVGLQEFQTATGRTAFRPAD